MSVQLLTNTSRVRHKFQKFSLLQGRAFGLSRVLPLREERLRTCVNSPKVHHCTKNNNVILNVDSQPCSLVKLSLVASVENLSIYNRNLTA